MSAVHAPLLGEIEPDEVVGNISSSPASNNARPVVLTPTNRATEQMATTESDAEAGIAGIFRQSAHPLALFFLFLFRIAAITVYLLSGFVTDNYVLSTVGVVVLLAMDFWNCEMLLVERWWVYDSGIKLMRTERVTGYLKAGILHARPMQSTLSMFLVAAIEFVLMRRPCFRMFWIAIYVFPLLWVALFIVSLLRFKLTFVPIVVLALVFNVTNAVGFTYADRDAKQRWANSVVSSGWSLGLGGIGGQLISGAVQKSVGRVFGS
ncbi:Golgi apparatus membrane protein TVP23 [Mycena leptocephala]|nr:Golgi apparatus membrane protein TVP23 [Mycena leptocephala]